MAAQITGVFKSGLQKPITYYKILVVGAGGIGCELLKNVVLKGFKSIEIIDLATIDVSNLSTLEFLSQKEHVGKSKATFAKESALSFAPSCNIVAHHDSIMKAEYDVNFFQQFDLCFNTVINHDVKNHVTRMCIAANIPLLEPGTVGYFGQVAVIKKSFLSCTIPNIVMEAIKILDKKVAPYTDTTRYEYVLSNEIWLKVLKMVPPQDLCSLVLSSRYMNSLASLPELWAQTKVKSQVVMEKGLIQLYIIKRFEKITAIDFSRMGDWETPEEWLSLMNDIPGSPLEQVNFSSNNMRGVPAEALAKAVASLKVASLRDTRLTTNQMERLMNDIPGSPLEQVNFSENNMRGVPSEALAKAVASLKVAILWDTHLITNQLSKVLEASLSSNSLEEIDLDNVNLSGVPSDLLAKAVARLRSVELRFTRLTPEQATSFINAILTSNTLVDVDLSGADLREVPSDLLAKAMGRLRSVNLESTRLTPEQSTSIMEAILTSITLVDVDLRRVDLSGVPSDLLAKAVGRLHRVGLSCTDLTGDQCVAVGQAVASSSSLLHADLRYNQFREKVPAHLFNALKLMDNVKII